MLFLRHLRVTYQHALADRTTLRNSHKDRITQMYRQVYPAPPTLSFCPDHPTEWNSFNAESNSRGALDPNLSAGFDTVHVPQLYHLLLVFFQPLWPPSEAVFLALLGLDFILEHPTLCLWCSLLCDLHSPFVTPTFWLLMICVRCFQAGINIGGNAVWHKISMEGIPTEDMNQTPTPTLDSDISTKLHTSISRSL